MREGEIQAQIVRALKQLGIEHLRINSGKVKVRGAWMTLAPEGTADILVMPYKKLPIWLECKTAVGKLSVEQVIFAARVGKLGHAVYIVRSLDDLEPLLKEMR
jgi:hypothetical protein